MMSSRIYPSITLSGVIMLIWIWSFSLFSLATKMFVIGVGLWYVDLAMAAMFAARLTRNDNGH
jgi:hypothetical protein